MAIVLLRNNTSLQLLLLLHWNQNTLNLLQVFPEEIGWKVSEHLALAPYGAGLAALAVFNI